ncbi:hypothetical protein [Leadbettera azotonutricia]|nr:hypothetical protein [Leadbettera azotonutricia]
MGKKDPKNNTALHWYNPDSLLLNIIVLVICVFGIAGSVWLFRKDLNDTRKRLEQEPVGFLSWKDNTVQRLASRRVQWDRLERYFPVYDGDTVSTAALSSGRISFVNGETVELSENTAIRIFYHDEDISRFIIMEGDVTVLADRYTVDLVSSLGSVNLNPKAKAELRTGEGLSIKMLQGSGVLVAGSRNRRAEAGEALELNRDGEFLEDPKVVMISPGRDGKSLAAGQGKIPVEFIWRTVNFPPNGGVRLEVARDKKFAQLASSWYGTNESSTLVDLEPGVYYWRAYMPPVLKGADSGRIEVLRSSAPQALFPSDGTVFSYNNQVPEINFTWIAPAEASQIILEAADNPAMERPKFRQLIDEVSGRGGSFAYPGLESGIWYWQIRPVYPDSVKAEEAPSLVNSFTLTRNTAFEAPLPLTPAVNSTAFTGSGRGDIYFSWKPLAEAENYTVLISQSEDLLNPLISETVNRNYYVYNGDKGILNEGEYYWGVFMTGPQNLRSPNSNPVFFIVRNDEASARTVFPPDNFAIPAARSPDLQYSWKNPYARPARFQISERADFVDHILKDDLIFGSGIQGPFLKPGAYYWRIVVEGDGDSGDPIFNSRPVPLTVIPALNAPKMIFPGNNENLRVEEGKAIKFTWERAAYADYYTAAIFLEGRNTPLGEIDLLSNNEIDVYFDTRTAGRFRWTVQGFTRPTSDNSGRNGLVGEGRFTISPPPGIAALGANWAVPRINNMIVVPGQQAAPITLVSPASGVNIPGINALRSPQEARWTSTDPLMNVQLIVSRNPDPISDPRAIILDAGRSARAMPFPSLTDGIWYWTVRADTSDGRGVGPGSSSWFTVLPIPPLPSPEQTMPANDAVISLAQMTRDRNITFSWNEVEGANAYIFTLFGDGEQPRVLLTNPPDPQPSFILYDLNILDQDNYLWQVEAVYRNRNGVLEQRGIAERHPFAFDIQVSDDIQVNDQGTRYGQ